MDTCNFRAQKQKQDDFWKFKATHGYPNYIETEYSLRKGRDQRDDTSKGVRIMMRKHTATADLS